MTEVTGRQLLSEALIRRLLTPRGGLIDDTNYGYDLVGELNDDLSPNDIGRIGSSIDQEMLKDERVLASKTQVLFQNGVLIVTILITDGTGPFPLVLQVSGVTISLLNTVS
jgi:hypothetical protein